MRNLDIGDYMLSPRVIVERKHIDDFIGSIKDGRIFRQVEALRDNAEIPLVIIESQTNINGTKDGIFDNIDTKMHINSIYGTIAHILIHTNIPVVFTPTPKDTAMLLASIARFEAKSHSEIPMRPQKKIRSLAERQVYLLEGLPNVSTILAKRMLEHFGTIKRIANADVKELMAVDGIGKKKAQEIRRVFEAEYME